MANIITNTDELQTILNILVEKGAAAGKTYSDAVKIYAPLILQGANASAVAGENFFNKQIGDITYTYGDDLLFTWSGANTAMATLKITNNNPILSCVITGNADCDYIHNHSQMNRTSSEIKLSVKPNSSAHQLVKAPAASGATTIKWSTSSLKFDWSLPN